MTTAELTELIAAEKVWFGPTATVGQYYLRSDIRGAARRIMQRVRRGDVTDAITRARVLGYVEGWVGVVRMRELVKGPLNFGVEA